MNRPVCNFEQTRVIAQRTIDAQATTIKAAPSRKLGARRGAMDDAGRYRLNAAECLSAATKCHSDYRSLLLSISTAWRALARQDEAIGDLLASWGIAAPAHEAGNNAEPSRQGAQMREIRIEKGAPQPASQATTGAGPISGVPSLSLLLSKG